MDTLIKFRELWESTENMVKFECRKLEGMRYNDACKRITLFYKKNILQNLWLADDFPNEYHDWMLSIRTMNVEKAEKITLLLKNKTQIIEFKNSTNENIVSGSVVGAGALVSAFKGKGIIGMLIMSLGIGKYIYDSTKTIKTSTMQDEIHNNLVQIACEIENILK